MDIPTLVGSIASSLTVTTAGVWWLGRTWVSHRLDRELARAKTSWEGDVKRNVEEYLAERAAEREYEFEARKRLYRAIGPLRFQLLTACRDAANHIHTHGLRGYTYSLDVSNYYGQSTLFRLIRPLALAELIERQIAYADFSVDSAAVDLLRFKRAAYVAFSSSRPICSHPEANWDDEEQHVFYHSLNRIANAIILTDAQFGERPLLFHEFAEFLKSGKNQDLMSPLPLILGRFSVSEHPIFWTRLAFYGYLCADVVNRHGKDIGFKHIDYDARILIENSDDRFTREHVNEMCEAFVTISKELL